MKGQRCRSQGDIAMSACAASAGDCVTELPVISFSSRVFVTTPTPTDVSYQANSNDKRRQ